MNSSAPTTSSVSHKIRIAAAVVGVALVMAACSATSGGGGDATSAESVPASDSRATNPAPTTEFVLFDGTAASFADYAGEPVVVNFWASWCPSCVAEMSAAFRPVQLDVGDAVAFLGMNIQDERDLALELLEETGVDWIQLKTRRGSCTPSLAVSGCRSPSWMPAIRLSTRTTVR